MLTDVIKSQSGCGELSHSLLIFLEVFLPMLFMTGLVIAIVYIVMDASLVIDKNGSGYLPVNTTYLYIYSLTNFVFHLLNSSAFKCRMPTFKEVPSPAPVPTPSAVPDEANQAFLRDPETFAAAAAPNENINPTSVSTNNNYGTHATASDDEETNPLVNGKAFLQQLNQTLLNVVTVLGIDVIRGAVVLITAIIISTTNVSSPYADAVSSLFVVVTMLPMFIPVVMKYCCVESSPN